MYSQVLKFNPNHAPAGSVEGGQFTSGKENGTRQSEAAAGTSAQGLPNGRSVSGSAGGVAAPGGTALGNSTPLKGLPTKVTVPGLGLIDIGPNPIARQAATDYMKSAGLPYDPPTEYVKVDQERAARIAAEYDKMQHDPRNPEVKAAYAQMIKEVEAQYQAVLNTGLKVEFIDYAKDGDPYAASPRLAQLDVQNNNHLWVFSTKDGFGSSPMDVSDNPLLAETSHKISGQPALANDLFRVVHDYFGHIKEGVGFRADGEENAWRSHSAMFSPLARRAMTSETRGQNSWVNFGPHGAANRTASSGTTVFADQKTGLLPEWVSEEGARKMDFAAVLKSNNDPEPKKSEGFASVLKFNKVHQPAGSSIGGQFGFSNPQQHAVGDRKYSALDAKIIDIHQDNRPLGKADEVTPLEKVMPDSPYVAYSNTPFFKQLNSLQETDPHEVTAKQYVDARHSLFKQQPLRDVPLKGLVVTQTVVNTAKINKMRDKIRGGDNKGGLAVVRYHGTNYLMDGHHRAAASYLEGKQSLSANVLDLDAKKDDMSSADLTTVGKRHPQTFPRRKFRRVVAI